MKRLDKSIIERYLSGTCTELDIEEILEWINLSEKNKKELFEMKILRSKGYLSSYSKPENVEKAYKELLNNTSQKKNRKFELPTFIKYAAAIFLIVGFTLYMYNKWSPADEKEIAVVMLQSEDSIQQITLDDNTKVWLSRNSKITFPEKFPITDRTVTIEGRAFFEVTKDPNRPFIVKANGHYIKVLGTSFEVNITHDKKLLDVILTEGSVSLSNNNDNVLCQLYPGQMFKYNKKEKSYAVNEVNADLYTSWRTGSITLDNLSFDDLIYVLSSYYEVDFIVETKDIQYKQLAGSLSLERNLDEILEILRSILPISCNIEMGKVYIYPN